MSAASIDIQKVATLARLKLTPEEAREYQAQLANILGYMDVLSRHDLSDAEPTAHALPVENALRADIARPGLTRDAALSNAPKRALDQIQIPKVLE